MKIACIAGSDVPSATANSIQVMKACHALAQTGAEVCLWLPGRGGADWEVLAQHYGLNTPFELRWLNCRRRWRRYDFTWRALKQGRAWQAELVYTWLPQVALLGLMYRLPTILEVHDRPTGLISPWLFRQFVRHPGKKRLLLITEALRSRLERPYRLAMLPPEAIQIAPNGSDLARYTGLPDAPTARRVLDLPEAPTAVYSGHFYPGRGIDLLLALAQRLPQTRFLWVGGNPAEVEAWQQRLAQLGVTNVHLSGFVENARLPLYQAAGDVLLMPYQRHIAGSSGGDSAEICSPMKMFDYLAAGRAILASDLPVLHEVLNADNAVLLPPEDVEAWSEALAALLDDPQRRSALAAQARRDAGLYTWEGRARRALQGF